MNFKLYRTFKFISCALIFYFLIILKPNNTSEVHLTEYHLTDLLTIRIRNHWADEIPIAFQEIIKERFGSSKHGRNDNENYQMTFEGPHGTVNFTSKIIKDESIASIFFTGEAILPNLENYDLVVGFHNISHPNYFRLPLYYLIQDEKTYIPEKININYIKKNDLKECNPNKKYFACFLVSSNYTNKSWRNKLPFDGCKARTDLFNELSKYKRIESGGFHLNNIGRIISKNETAEWMGQCKFVIAYENQSYDGYITEKPFQAYYAGAIPIYYGHPTAAKDLNKKAIIYAGDYKAQDNLIEYIKKVDQDDKLYCNIWNENIISDPKRNYNYVISEFRKKLLDIIDAKYKK